MMGDSMKIYQSECSVEGMITTMGDENFAAIDEKAL
jgi:hypothetical protein